MLLAAAVQQMLPSPPVTCIGIDLGTTFSCVAVFEDGEIVVIPNRAGQSITPSVVFVPASNGSHAVEPFVGDSARPTAAEMPGTLLYDGKRFIGKQYDGARVLTESVGLPFDLTPEFSTTRQQLEARLKLTMGGQPLTFAGEHIGSMIVRELREQAEGYVGRDIHKAVLAVPVGFNRKQINATREAAELAGLEVLRMIHEPTAAAMAYGLHTHADVSIVMVYDMGGGTLDVSLLYLNNGIFEVMAAAGDNRLGGQDFNLALLQHLVREVQRRLPEAEVEGDAEVMRVLREEAERVKVALNDECDCAGNFYDGDAQAVVQVQLPPSLEAAAPLSVTRAEYEKLAAELFERALAPVKQVLGRVEMQAAQVDELVLVGGSTRMAKVRALLRDFFAGKEPNCAVSPEEAVAHGTAIQAAILTDRKKISIGATEAGIFEHLDYER